MKVFIYKENENICVGMVTEEQDIKEQAKRCTPEGLPFLIVDVEELPMGIDTTALDVDFSEPDGIGTFKEPPRVKKVQ